MIKLFFFVKVFFSTLLLHAEDSKILIIKHADTYETFIEFESIDPSDNEDLAKKEAIFNAKKNAFIELKLSEKFENIKISSENIDKVINSYTVEDYEYEKNIVKISLKIYFNKALIENLNNHLKNKINKNISGSEVLSIKIDLSEKDWILNKTTLINFCKLNKISFKFDKIIYPNLFINLANIDKNLFIQEIADQHSLYLENLDDNVYLLR